MAQARTENRSIDFIRVMLVDLDPIFRLGLKTWLDEAPEIEVVANFGRSSEILPRLEALQAAQETSDRETTDQGARDQGASPVDLLVWSLDVRQASRPANVGVPQMLRLRYPSIPILVLIGQVDTLLLEALRQSAVQGCWLKDINQDALLATMRQIAAGQVLWDERLVNLLAQSGRSPRTKLSRQIWGARGTLFKFQYRFGLRGLQEIESGLTQLNQMLAGPGLGVWERVVLEGRYREMQAARKVVQRWILPKDAKDNAEAARDWPTAREEAASREGMQVSPVTVSQGNTISNQEAIGTINQGTINQGAMIQDSLATVGIAQSVVITENQFQTVKSGLLNAVSAKIPSSLHNLTPETLELDILQPEKRQELFFIILRGIEETLDDLRFSHVQRAQLAPKRSRILLELWRLATADFVGKYSTLAQTEYENPAGSPSSALTQDVEIISVLLQDSQMIERVMLDKIPLVIEWFDHLLYQAPLQVDNQSVPFGSPAAMRQAEAILENWVIRMANAVVAPLLNEFGSEESIKHNFYDRRWISTREIERFRNALSWKYRMQQLFSEPKYIFESQIPLLVFRESGIRSLELYSPRDLELQQLRGFPLMVTLALEARDAIAPPLRATFTWVGRGVVYVLTQVVGRGIGLIGRGIIQGVGTAWQETRSNRRTVKEEKY